MELESGSSGVDGGLSPAPEAHEVSSETVARWSAERIGPTIIAAPQRGGSWLECDNEAAQGDDKAERRVQESVKTRECRVASDLEDLEMKLLDFQHYFNGHRTHAG
jgi:hypothetical protein